MKRIQCLTDLNNLAGDIPDELLNYLSSEFSHLYEYLGNGERIEEFILENHLAILIVEDTIELDLLLQNRLDLEYVEEIQINSSMCLRIGISQLEDIQLHYYFKV
ncbi:MULTISPECIES: hypothetical protein [Bacillus cereus group]|uniref:hypothetical protein n=1 Tax=Bacillus cereus group TaxID=86661 RepID=UPI0013D53797|nr:MULTISPECIES: hypothetical protein [Bacillus cereus group]MDK7433811.1 hypothetical protein [Bacillus paranthracis]MDK7467610.1 hypothetical protein [Bacillus paranthracis]MDK7483974.1 hypothetical protein [Bacillus paranthracis]MDK7495400.1 hypothetical protein [Bacillus paranthracis]MDK7498328.1 hypothetical protein [Bacillus paranthracis]